MNQQRCPNKQHNLYRHQAIRYKDDTIIDSTHTKSQTSDQKMSKISEIKVVNDFSVDSQCLDRSSILEQSLENDLRQWQQAYKIDNLIVQKLEKDIKDIDNQIVQIATQFDVCMNLQQKTEAKFKEFQQLMKGTQFIKFSRSNCKKWDQRMIFYCSFLDSICWKSKTSKFPSAKQTIPIDQIIQIHTNYNKYKLIKKNFVLPPNAEQDCFLAIEAKNGIRLELLAENKEDQFLYAKILNLLINKDRCVKNQNQFIIEQYSVDINLIRKNLEGSKKNFLETIDKLQQSFISTTSTLLKQEKEKTKTIKKKSQHYVFQSKLQLEDINKENKIQKKQIKELQLENDYLESRIEQLQEYYTQRQLQIKSSTNPQQVQLYQIIKDIIGMNGDQSIHNESQYEYQPQDYHEENVKNLQKLSALYDRQQSTEIELRQYLKELQEEKSQIATQLQQSQFDLHEQEMYIIELENINNLLQTKLQDVNQVLEFKEQQFSNLVQDMQKLQQEIPKLMNNNHQQSVNTETRRLQTENDKLKDTIQNKIRELKNQMIKEEQNWMNFFVQIISYICYHIAPDDLSSDINITIQGLYYKLCDKAYGESQIQLDNLMNSIKQKANFFQKQYKEQFEQMFKDQQAILCSLASRLPSPKTTNSRQSSHQTLHLDKTFQSPSRVFVKNKAKLTKDNHPLDSIQIQYLTQLIK
ncbi:unnamed protein product (macronuclear) [Paramecium tetraurelia]|uniref:PH domain-containing protein n=1 Tax=Paramecium tetraurelia TaxID=5888 RepID=A0BN93_PARTE|nr:uncharacterized protein GSPATT00030648001 [Paramecium tetraurelia]CAK60010.1 unnamed protein product [Paramecium tetraurelia]|eukprot:XP_001427408.1 hypothetical protein (macronuclear) [Paramecium tetraurelia strain d4-2]